MNKEYQKDTSAEWDLRCSAAYDSDYFWFTFDLMSNGSGDDLSPHYPPSLLMCPVVSDALVIQSWFVYEDLVFYSADSVYWNDMYTIWGRNAFPSVYDQPASSKNQQTNPIEGLNTDHTILVKFGDNTDVRLNREQFAKMISLLNSLHSAGSNVASPSDEQMEERNELMALLGLKTKVPEVKEELIDGYAYSRIELPSLTLQIQRKDDMEYFIAANEYVYKEVVRHRNEVSIHSITEACFVVTEKVPFTTPTLIDFAHTLVVDDTVDYSVLMSVKKESNSVQLKCVASIAVENMQLLLPCVYLAAADKLIKEGVPVDHEEVLHVGRDIVLQHISLPVRTSFRSEVPFDEDTSFVILDYKSRLNQYVIYAKDTSTF